MLQPVKVALGEFMGRFYASLVPTTKGLESYVLRGLPKNVLWAPGRMVDQAEDMLSSFQRNDTDSATTQPPKMPVIIIALAKDYVPTGRDYTRQIADKVFVILPKDAQERSFGLRVMAGDVRAQVAIFAGDEATARALAAQFVLFLEAAPNRRFNALYPFAGHLMPWPVQVESSESPALSIQNDAKNLTILAVDVTLKAEIPLYDAPAPGQPNDGKGTPGDANDPPGYLLVAEVTMASEEAPG